MKKNKGILIKNLEKAHENKWVALTTDRTTVIAYDDNLNSLMKKVGNNKVVFTKIPPVGAIFAF